MGVEGHRFGVKSFRMKSECLNLIINRPGWYVWPIAEPIPMGLNFTSLQSLAHGSMGNTQFLEKSLETLELCRISNRLKLTKGPNHFWT